MRNRDIGEKMEGGESKKHFVLVHGACHGAWCWYKLSTLLTSVGHRVTAFDLAACGVHPKKLSEVHTFSDYSEPLIEILASLPSQEKVILVGHSFGGFSISRAMNTFPEKISAAVFVAALMPDSSNPPSYVIEKHLEKTHEEPILDSQIMNTLDRGVEYLFGPNFLGHKLYQCSSLEDLTLATTLIRVASFFLEDLRKGPIFSKENYGSVSRVYIVCDEDKTITEDFQRWMIENNPVKEVKVIQGSDHMPMFSKPQELCNHLLEIAKAYP
ncbi:salicylic acid-binding protein 2-like isoform X1 [Tasmannia lanceolata]|uniref:salicylic acid-binding protein 2-like isoform X1 n=1 Tax=Tasmannia lanceolata TaxID=3420 RepID=UPI004064029A